MSLIYSSVAFGLGFILDLLFGDPHGMPHIVVAMGRMISGLEKLLRRWLPQKKRLAGLLLVLAMLVFWTGLPFLLLHFLYNSWPYLGLFLETLLVFQLLAAKSLRRESMLVQQRLLAGDLAGARQDLAMIVGRDTEDLAEEGIVKAAVETVAENTADGVIAPMFYILLGGAGLGCLYKAINTMDSMLGYKDERYLDFGRAAALLDDAANYLPARLAAYLMLLGTRLAGFNSRQAWRIYRRDRKNHASPNSAQTEAVMAGALDLELAGDAFYKGRLVKKPSIGTALRPAGPEDIARANKLMYVTTFLMVLVFLLLRALTLGGVFLARL